MIHAEARSLRSRAHVRAARARSSSAAAAAAIGDTLRSFAFAVLAALGAAMTATVGWGCGYKALHSAGPVPDSERLAVVVVASHVTPTSAADEVANGVREALSESGALRGGTGFPRAEVEVLRIDQESDAIAAISSPASGADFPRARGLRVGVVARAWLRRTASDGPSADTGDVRAFTVLAADVDPGGSAELLLERAARAAGRQAGIRLGARLLGHPTASE